MSTTYTEELQGSINNSNNEFIQEEYTLDHANEAAKLSLYYAHGNTEKNNINYRNAKIDEGKALKLNEQAVQGINLANNASTAANQSLVDSGKATSNVSTAAANMQIAANAITKLSSDVAGILAVANAADHGSQIQDSVGRAYEKITKAAKLAEEVSLVSLNATIEAAQSTASTVVTDAQLALSSMTSFQGATAAQYSAASALAVSSNEGVTDARKTEKEASGAYDITRKQDEAIKTTRKLINKVSNHNLDLFDPALVKNKLKVKVLNNGNKEDASFKVAAGKSYTISFNKLEGDGLNPGTTGANIEDGDYIQYYRLIMVKYDASAAFDINTAKNLPVGTYYQFEPNGYKGYSRTFYLLGTDQALIPYDPKAVVETDPISLDSYDSKHVRGIAVDNEGKPIEAGEYYVSYVYAVYTDEYQKLISNTDGFLSLPSKDTQLQMNLTRIPVHMLDKDQKKKPNLIVYDPVRLNSRDFAVQFEVYQKNYDPSLMEYRVMMVEKANVDAKKLNAKVQAALENLDAKEYKYNTEKLKFESMEQALNEMEVNFNTTQAQILELETQLETVNDEVANYQPNKAPQYLTGQQDQLKAQIEPLQASLNANNAVQQELEGKLYGTADNPGGQQQAVSDAAKAYQNALQLDEDISKKKIEKNVSDFIFDSDLMSVVSAANYYPATPFKWDESSARVMVKEANETLRLSKTKATQAIQNFATYNHQLRTALQAVEDAEDDVMMATTKFNNAETNLDNVEINALSSSKPTKAENAAINLAIAALHKAQRELDNKTEILDSKEVELEVVKSNGATSQSGLENLLDDCVSSTSLLDRAETIQGLSKELKKNNSRVSPGMETVLFYTETGEDATDNYGEPLQFNDISSWKTTFDIFQELWSEKTSELKSQYLLLNDLVKAIHAARSKEDKLKKAIEVAILKVFKDADLKLIWMVIIPDIIEAIETDVIADFEEIAKAIISAKIQAEVLKASHQIIDEVVTQYLAQETSDQEISYQAVVLTTITSDDEEVVAQYRLQHSQYSDDHALWGVID